MARGHTKWQTWGCCLTCFPWAPQEASSAQALHSSHFTPCTHKLRCTVSQQEYYCRRSLSQQSSVVGYNRNLIAGPKWSPLLTTDMFPPHQPADLWLSSPFPYKKINFSFPVLSDLALLSPIPLLSSPAAHGLAATSAWSTGLVLFSPSQDCTAAKQNIWTSHWSSFGRQFWRTVMRDGGWAASSYCTVSCWTSGFWWGSPD